jgi:predicted ATPase
MEITADNPIPGNSDVGRKDPEAAPCLTGPCLLHALTPRNLLSFGPETPPFSLYGLNVVIGPNGSGKSNLLEVVSLLRSLPLDCRPVILKGGGVAEWIWKGRPHERASVNAVVYNPFGNQPLRHVFEFETANQSFQITDERIENELAYGGQSEPYFYYRFQGGNPVINVAATTTSSTTTTSTSSPGINVPRGTRRQLSRDKIDPEVSILAQRRDSDNYPEITHLVGTYSRIRLYREWAFGRNTVFREPQKADGRNDRLEEDFSNLGLFLNRLRRHPRAKNALVSALKDLYEGLTDFDVSIEGGTVQVFFTEGEFTIPATRLSDGSLRFLCLLAILCDPDPPPLIGIEEPELGLHPDLLPKLADRLIDASRRCQLIVTTHSDVLVDALSEHPDSVVVCEKHAGMTSLQRLDPKELAPWLENYRLGQLWTRGQIGGTRW